MVSVFGTFNNAIINDVELNFTPNLSGTNFYIFISDFVYITSLYTNIFFGNIKCSCNWRIVILNIFISIFISKNSLSIYLRFKFSNIIINNQRV